ncbi:M20 family metallopeptidase [Halobacterium litoreum]|nr:M20 family metallopeptidase [Halobacterium litoreum]UHH14387.1 M20 family metallopeptidase [Halobacterium litoreum]
MTVDPPAAVASFPADERDALVSTALDLVGCDTQNPPGETTAAAEYVAETVRDWGLEPELFAVDPAKPNVLFEVPGERDATLLFEGHLDTVPFDADAWTHDPLGERDGDRVYGRGATDMKGAVAAMLLAARAHVETDTTPPVSLQFAFVSDEETAGDAGLSALLADREFDADACVIGETTCERGRHSVTVADKGSIWLTLTARGEAAHGSRPMLGANAIDRLYEAVETLRERFGRRPLDVPDALDSVVAESVEYYAPTLGEDAARDLFGYPTVNLGTLSGGEAVNAVPASATAELDIRLTAGVDTRAVLADVRECVRGCEGVSVADASWSVGTYEPIDSPLVEAVTGVASDVSGERVYRRSATGGGDAKSLRNAGVPTVEFGFGTDTAHAADEYTTATALAWNAAVYTRLPYALAPDL